MPYLVYRVSEEYLRVEHLKKEKVVEHHVEWYDKEGCVDEQVDVKTYYVKENSRLYKVPPNQPINFQYVVGDVTVPVRNLCIQSQQEDPGYQSHAKEDPGYHSHVSSSHGVESAYSELYTTGEY